MGRKIPGKKHHGVKDPEKQRQARFDRIKQKINARPDKEDHQDLPKSLRMMMAARDQVKATGTYEPFPSRKNTKDPSTKKTPEEKTLLDSTRHTTFEGPLQKGMTRPLKPIPVFKQGQGEHKRAFYYRIDQTIQSMKKRAKFEDKYKVEVRTDNTGKPLIVDREKDEVELEAEKKLTEKLAKKGIVRKTKEEKRVLRRQREKMRKNKKKKSNADLDFSDFKDDVVFGDTVDAPPTLKFKNFDKNPSSKPAQEGRGDLLLHTVSHTGGGKVKKAKLSLAQKVRVERDRQSVVEQYRQKKAAMQGLP